MARKRTDLGPGAKRKIATLIARGATAEAITKALQADGVEVSESTIARRVREQRANGAPTRVSPSAALRAQYADAVADSGEVDDLPKPEAIPENAELEQINRWLERAEKLGKAAYAQGDLEGMGKMGRLASALLERKRKATPPEKADPRDNPDMVKLAEEARAKMHKYIDQALGK